MTLVISHKQLTDKKRQ